MTQTAYKHITLHDDGTLFVEGTRFKIKNLVLAKAAYGFSPEALGEQYPQLTLGQIYSALAYYEDHREALDSEIQGDLETAEVLREELDAVDLKATLKARAGR